VIALDTNVLVRFLVEDHPEQTARARALLQRAVDADASCYVSDIVLCELVWVLERSYKLRRDAIGGVLSRLLRARHLRFSSIELLYRSLEAYTSRTGGFADFLIREHAQTAGCEAVATFDGDLILEKGFIAP
jgi:predicted nucleic-acid-binding protein